VSHGVLRLAGVLAPLLLTACSTVSSYTDRLFGSTPAEKPAALVQFTPSATIKVTWQASAGKADVYVFTPAFAGGSVYAAAASGQVTRLDAATGRAVWQADARQGISGGVGADGDIVVVGTPRGEAVAFDNGGKLLWKAQLSGEVLAAPEIADGIVVVRTGDGRIHGLDVADGRRKWLYQRSTPTLSVRTNAGVAITRGAVFAGFPGGRLVALTLGTGGVGWEAAVALPRGATELERIADITSVPVVDGPNVCAVAFQGRTACFDAVRGTLAWARELSSVVGLSVDARYLYVTDDRNAVHALDKSSGASIWKQDKLTGRRVSAPLPVRGYLLVGDLQGYVHAMNRETGEFVARIATDGSAIVARPMPFGDGVLVQTRNGGLFALNIE